MKNIILIFGFAFSIFLTGCKEPAHSQESVISPIEFQEKITKVQDIQLIDVRTPEEFSEGHVTNAQNIDFYSDDFKEQVSKLDPEKPTYVYCRSGIRSAKSAEILKDLGFKEVYDMKGGFTNWAAEELAIEQ